MKRRWAIAWGLLLISVLVGQAIQALTGVDAPIATLVVLFFGAVAIASWDLRPAGPAGTPARRRPR